MTARPSRSGLGGVDWRRVNTWIIALNIAVFVIDGLFVQFGVKHLFDTVMVLNDDNQLEPVKLFMGPLEWWGHFSVDKSLYSGQIWRLISFQFLHANLRHILFNMIGLLVFGSLVERYLGSRRYLAFYLLCGVCGPLLYCGFAWAGLLSTTADTPLVGASAGLFGVLIAAAVIAPNAEVMLLFPPIPVKLRHLAIFFVFLAVYTVLFFGHQPGQNAGGEAAHLGGAAMGYLLIRRAYLLNVFERLPVGPRSDIQFARRDRRGKD